MKMTTANRVAKIVTAIDTALTGSETFHTKLIGDVLKACAGLETFADVEALRPDVEKAIVAHRWYGEATAIDYANKVLRITQAQFFAGKEFGWTEGQTLGAASIEARRALQKLGLVQTRARGRKEGSTRSKTPTVATGAPDAAMIERAASKLADERTVSLNAETERARNETARARTDATVALAKLATVESDWSSMRDTYTALNATLATLLQTVTSARAEPIIIALRAMGEVIARNAPNAVTVAPAALVAVKARKRA